MSFWRGFFLLVGVYWLFTETAYVMEEGEQGIITKFGEYRYSVTTPGLKFKVPFAETIHRMQKRILSSDTAPTEYLTADKKRLVADPLTRWRVKNPIVFFKTVHSELEAKARLDDIVNSELRREIATVEFDSIIGSQREALTERVENHAREQLARLGIALVDIRIKRADLPKEVEESVFQRMRAERDRIAKKYRSEGAEEAQKIQAETDRDRTILLAEAYQQTQSLRGEGDAQSISISAAAFGKDADYYSFIRSLEAYEKSFDEHTKLVLSTDSGLLRHMQNASK